MTRIVVLGAGNIGCCVAHLLSSIGDYKVTLADMQLSDLATQVSQHKNITFHRLDINNQQQTHLFCQTQNTVAICCCLPFTFNLAVANIAFKLGVHYFDLTEDRLSSQAIQALDRAPKQVMISQCGLAPGLVNLLVNNYVINFKKIDNVEINVGALPKSSALPMNHAHLWSIDGLINEYVKPAQHILNGITQAVSSLSDVSTVTIKGATYEAFSTSGGVGSLVSILANKAENVRYRTLRHPGHCQKMLFLLDELGLRDDLSLLKKILTQSLKSKVDDQVVISLIVDGIDSQGQPAQHRLNKIYYSKTIRQFKWAAIQWTTAASLCAVVDLACNSYFNNKVNCQDIIPLDDFINNRFGALFDL